MACNSGVPVHAFLQAVVGNQMIEMVQVVNADVGGQPLQEFRQRVIRASLHAGLEIVPLLVLLPVGFLELVLNIKEPHANRCPCLRPWGR